MISNLYKKENFLFHIETKKKTEKCTNLSHDYHLNEEKKITPDSTTITERNYQCNREIIIKKTQCENCAMWRLRKRHHSMRKIVQNGGFASGTILQLPPSSAPSSRIPSSFSPSAPPLLHSSTCAESGQQVFPGVYETCALHLVQQCPSA